jgi:tetratricopeptide (TPR) repeat protein
MALSTGQVLHNRYRIVKLLGQGGFGAVYHAWDVQLSGPCALKENFDTSPSARNQFSREASLLYNLRHPGLPKVIDHFVVPGQGQYLVMEYIEGQDLQGMLDASLAAMRTSPPASGEPAQANRGLPATQVIPWILQVCEALEYLHRHKPPIIHRDVKPANIRITPEGQAVLVDFGIAKIYDAQSSTTLGARAVTPGFSPVEQYGQGGTDSRTDIYALGATLYNLLTGQAPPESIQRVAQDTLVPPRVLNPGIHPLIASAIMKAMQLNPQGRFQSVSDFAAVLKGGNPTAPDMVTVSAAPVVARVAATVAAPVVQKQPVKRRSFKWAAILVGILLLIGILAGGVWLSKGLLFPDQLQAPGSTALSQPATMQRMDGDFNVAVAGFTVNGYAENPNLGAELADNIAKRLQEIYQTWKLDIDMQVWGPEQAGQLLGQAAEARSQAAQELAARVGADMMVYGLIDASGPVWQVTPEFYIFPESFSLGSEIAGPNELGAPFPVYGPSDTEKRIDFNAKMSGRVEVLSRISLGLAYLSSKNYTQAIEQFRIAESLPGWAEYQGKYVLYLLLGNAYLKSSESDSRERLANFKAGQKDQEKYYAQKMLDDMSQAEKYYKQAWDSNPGYARALVGLAGVYLGRAQVDFATTSDPADLNQELLKLAQDTYNQALSAPIQPAHADVPARVHYGLGQAYLLQSLVGAGPKLETMIAEFQQVIDAYSDGANPRIRDITIESHARLGYIYDKLMNKKAQAAEEYQKAIDLSYDVPDRQEIYQKRLEEIKSALNP